MLPKKPDSSHYHSVPTLSGRAGPVDKVCSDFPPQTLVVCPFSVCTSAGCEYKPSPVFRVWFDCLENSFWSWLRPYFPWVFYACCLSYFSVAAPKHHGHDSLWSTAFNWTYDLIAHGQGSVMMEQRLLRAHGLWSSTGGRHRDSNGTHTRFFETSKHASKWHSSSNEATPLNPSPSTSSCSASFSYWRSQYRAWLACCCFLSRLYLVSQDASAVLMAAFDDTWFLQSPLPFTSSSYHVSLSDFTDPSEMSSAFVPSSIKVLCIHLSMSASPDRFTFTLCCWS